MAKRMTMQVTVKVDNKGLYRSWLEVQELDLCHSLTKHHYYVRQMQVSQKGEQEC